MFKIKKRFSLLITLGIITIITLAVLVDFLTPDPTITISRKGNEQYLDSVVKTETYISDPSWPGIPLNITKSFEHSRDMVSPVEPQIKVYYLNLVYKATFASFEFKKLNSTHIILENETYSSYFLASGPNKFPYTINLTNPAYRDFSNDLLENEFLLIRQNWHVSDICGDLFSQSQLCGHIAYVDRTIISSLNGNVLIHIMNWYGYTIK